ncbi:MAG TPA: type II secretion system protein GspC [Candidatus Binataceae bacterium]|nr:type II secretion system protein GspC [Candidatus Binataceae bacterium]
MTFNLHERYLYALNAMLVVAIAYFAALAVSDMIRLRMGTDVVPATTLGTAAGSAGLDAATSRATYQAIAQRDVFNLAPAPEAAPVATEDLNVTLLGTSHLSGGLPPFAIIETQAGDQSLYRLGDTIPDVGRLVQIGHNRVIVDRNGRHVALVIPHDDSAIPDQNYKGLPAPLRMRGLRRPFNHNPMLRRFPPTAAAAGVHRIAPNRYALDRSAVDHNMQNMAQLFTQIRAVPNLQNGTANGFVLSEIQPGSIFQNIGLQDGDVLTNVSGQPVGDPAKAMQMLSTLGSRSSITLGVIRNGTPVQLSYSIH